MTVRHHWDASKAVSMFRAAGVAALDDAGEFLLGEANTTAPIEEGTLVRSGQSTVDPSRMVATVSYDTPYAVRQHEDTRLRHDPGRRAKWLELTFREQAPRLTRFLAASMRRRVT